MEYWNIVLQEFIENDPIFASELAKHKFYVTGIPDEPEYNLVPKPE